MSQFEPPAESRANPVLSHTPRAERHTQPRASSGVLTGDIVDGCMGTSWTHSDWHSGLSERGGWMPFRGVSMKEQRAAFVAAAGVEGANVRAACRAFGISPTTGYKWLARAAVGDIEERSRRPHGSPGATAADVEEAVLAVRGEHPTWGGRKIHHALRLSGVGAPQPSTITGIL